MKIAKTDEKGFTLIEVIVSLVLLGITASLAGMWIVSVANGYVFAKMNASAVQKAQLAMTRLTKEFSAIKSVYSISNGLQIKYRRADSTGDKYYKVFQSGDKLILASTTDLGNPTTIAEGDVLTDKVSSNSLGLQYCDSDNTTCGTTWLATSKIIKITLTLTGGSNTPVTFVQSVTPRNF